MERLRKEILNYFTQNYPGFSIKHDQVINGKSSKTKRQIDILIEGLIAGFKITIVIDCKFFSKNIDVKDVDSFSSMVEDVGAHQGVLITNKGFSKAAINRAYYGNSKVELDILNFEELKEFQGLAAIPYAENISVIFSAPFGWIVDIKDKVNSIASLYQRGLTLKDAQRCNEWMYIEFWKLKNSVSTIEELISFQNSYMVEDQPGIRFEYDTLVSRKDSLESKIRIADVRIPAIFRSDWIFKT
ncbi:MAG: restriction endonuclease [Bacteroidetes bacterium]|nr:restriction endonuclease [Bacteroidota bacterium]